MSTKLQLAAVLCAVASHGLACGQILEAEPALIKSLAANGDVDPHKDAVAARKAAGAEIVRSTIELAAEQQAAAADVLRVEIAQLEDLHGKEADEATKAALAKQLEAKQLEAKQLEAKRSELAALS